MESVMDVIVNIPYLYKILASLAVAVIIGLLANVVSKLVARERGKNSEAPFVIRYTALFLIGLGLVFIWVDGLGQLLTALTLVAAAMILVAKELILNFIGSLVIIWRELFTIGDRVQVADISGDVIEKGLFYFTLLEVGGTRSAGHSTGRLIKVPNALVLTTPVVNGTRGAGYLWNELSISLTRQTDWEAARDLLLAIVDEYYGQENLDLERIKSVFEKKRVFFKRLTPRVYLEVVSGGFRLTLRYLCRARLARESQDFVITRFVIRGREAGIELADSQE